MSQGSQCIYICVGLQVHILSLHNQYSHSQYVYSMLYIIKFRVRYKVPYIIVCLMFSYIKIYTNQVLSGKSSNMIRVN